jgi:hypothetical protein
VERISILPENTRRRCAIILAEEGYLMIRALIVWSAMLAVLAVAAPAESEWSPDGTSRTMPDGS